MSDTLQSVLTPDTDTDPRDSRVGQNVSTTRRKVLRAAGLVAVAGGGAAALAACGADSATPSSSAAPSSSDPSSSAPSSSAPSASESSSADSSAKAPGGASVTKAEVPEGGGIIMQDAAFVVTQPEAGTYKAFSKICTHQGCPVAMITNKEIVCKCHGSHFSISDGSVVSGPAQKPLPEAKATVSGDNIVISA